ncbi:MAG TPA: hypothetical protein V6C97_35415 [Oculatellaceae cyanobacterium]
MWRERLAKHDKLALYRTFKMHLCLEEYLLSPDVKGRSAMTRVRVGTNELLVEQMRYQKEGRDDHCRMCGVEAEDVTHVMLHCEAYDELRGKTLTDISKATNRAIDVIQMESDGARMHGLIGSGVGLDFKMRRACYAAVLRYITAVLLKRRVGIDVSRRRLLQRRSRARRTGGKLMGLALLWP